jgi:hypothetical protein
MASSSSSIWPAGEGGRLAYAPLLLPHPCQVHRTYFPQSPLAGWLFVLSGVRVGDARAGMSHDQSGDALATVTVNPFHSPKLRRAHGGGGDQSPGFR